jgi:hypothetical protein
MRLIPYSLHESEPVWGKKSMQVRVIQEDASAQERKNNAV